MRPAWVFPTLLLCWTLPLAATDPGLKAPHKITLDAPGDTAKGVGYKLKSALLATDFISIRWIRGQKTNPAFRTDSTRNTTSFTLPAGAFILPPAPGVTDTIYACLVVMRPTVGPSLESCSNPKVRTTLGPHPGLEPDVQLLPASLTMRSGGVTRFCPFLLWSDGVATRSRPFHQDCEAAFQIWRKSFRLRTQATSA